MLAVGSRLHVDSFVDSDLKALGDGRVFVILVSRLTAHLGLRLANVERLRSVQVE